MDFKENYNYRFISKDKFDIKILDTRTFNVDIYRKYKIVKYINNNKTGFYEIFNDNTLEKIPNIIKIYDTEKIISGCTGFDGEYDKLTYYHIDDLYFIEYINEDLIDHNQNNIVKEELIKKGLL